MSAIPYPVGMVWRKKPDEKAIDLVDSEKVDIYATETGVIVEGSTSAVTVFIDQMLATTKEAGGQSRHLIVDGLSVAANIAAYRQTHREYIEFSERAVELLRKNKVVPSQGGYFYGIVKKAGKFAGNLDFKKVNLGPEQALSMQVAAGQLALKAAIKDVLVALDRIEGKVDKLAKLAQAERLGAVLGDRATLHPLVDRVRSTGKLSGTDWATIASLGPLIARDIETLRAHILRELADVDAGSFVRDRAEEAEDLTDRLLKESVALLVVAEQNYALWQELRLAQAVNHEIHAVEAVTHDIRQQLAALTTADQRVVDTLARVLLALTESTGYEGFAPLQKRKLSDHERQINGVMNWFADQRHLDHTRRGDTAYPGFVESLDKVRESVESGVRKGTKRLVSSSEKLIDRIRDDQKALPEAIDET